LNGKNEDLKGRDGGEKKWNGIRKLRRLKDVSKLEKRRGR